MPNTTKSTSEKKCLATNAKAITEESLVEMVTKLDALLEKVGDLVELLEDPGNPYELTNAMLYKQLLAVMHTARVQKNYLFTVEFTSDE